METDQSIGPSTALVVGFALLSLGNVLVSYVWFVAARSSFLFCPVGGRRPPDCGAFRMTVDPWLAVVACLVLFLAPLIDGRLTRSRGWAVGLGSYAALAVIGAALASSHSSGI